MTGLFTFKFQADVLVTFRDQGSSSGGIRAKG